MVLLRNLLRCSVQFERPDLGLRLGALTAGCATALQHPAVTMANATATAWPSDLSLQVAPTEPMARITTRLGPSKSCLRAPNQG